MDYRFNIRIDLNHNELGYYLILNDMADYLEANDPPPNHWDEKRREDFYKTVRDRLSKKAKIMLRKLLGEEVKNGV